jgi:hypothetical protein
LVCGKLLKRPTKGTLSTISASLKKCKCPSESLLSRSKEKKSKEVLISQEKIGADM